MCVFLLLDEKDLAVQECRRLGISMASKRLPDSVIRSSLNNHVRNRKHHFAQKFKVVLALRGALELLREVPLPVAHVIVQTRTNCAVSKTYVRNAHH